MRRTIFALILFSAALSAAARSRFTYIYAPTGANYTISKGSVDEIVKLNKRLSGAGPYLWVRLDGREYVIRDAGLLAEVERARAPLRALEPEQRELDRKMKPLEKREDRLENELDELTDRDEDDEELTAAERDRVRELRAQLRDLRREMRQYEREENELDRREDELDRVFDDEVERITERAIRNGIAQPVR